MVGFLFYAQMRTSFVGGNLPSTTLGNPSLATCPITSCR